MTIEVSLFSIAMSLCGDLFEKGDAQQVFLDGNGLKGVYLPPHPPPPPHHHPPQPPPLPHSALPPAMALLYLELAYSRTQTVVY